MLASYQRSLKAEGLESFSSVRPRRGAAERVVSGKFAGVFLGRDLQCKVARLALSQLDSARGLLLQPRELDNERL